jgi:hypothetical protein
LAASDKKRRSKIARCADTPRRNKSREPARLHIAAKTVLCAVTLDFVKLQRRHKAAIHQHGVCGVIKYRDSLIDD